MCAAPGGKTTHIAEIMNNEGSILATDIHRHKLDLIEENCASVLESISMKQHQLTAEKQLNYYNMNLTMQYLVDAPCSGLGVMRRKPDIKYTKSEEILTVYMKFNCNY